MPSLTDIKDRKPNAELIDFLEQKLAHANSGELRSMICVFGWSDDSWSNGWALDIRNGTRPMLGELAMLQFDMLSNIALKDGDTTLARL